MPQSPARLDDRAPASLRPVHFELDFVRYAAGSVIISFGHTRVLCNASLEKGVPRWMRDSGEGWVTAEYAMLPAATHTRGRRERDKVSGRSAEIQRLIGRALRASIDRKLLGEHTIIIDCDVLQADGGTRTAAITGGFVALALACHRLLEAGGITRLPLLHAVSAVSAGIVGGSPLLDLNYEEDSQADVDLNLVMTSGGQIVEIQGTGEGGLLARDDLDRLVDLGAAGCDHLCKLQAEVLAPFKSLAPLWQTL